MAPVSLASLFRVKETPGELWSWLLNQQIGTTKWQFEPWTNAR